MKFFNKVFFITLFFADLAFAVNIQQPRFSESFEYLTLPDGGEYTDDFHLSFPKLILSYDQVKNPLISKTENNSIKSSVLVESFSTLNFGLHQDLSSRWGLTLDTSLTDVSLPLGEKSGVLGDLNLKIRYRFKETKKSKYSLHGTVTVPMGDDEYFLSDESFGYGLRFQYETVLSSRLKGTFLLGYFHSDESEFLDLDYRNQVQTSVGISYKLTSKFFTNLEWSRKWTQPFNSNLNPNEAILGFRYQPSNRLAIFLGAGTGGFEDQDSSDYRLMGGVKIRPGRIGKTVSKKNILENKGMLASAPVVRAESLYRNMLYKSQHVFFDFESSVLNSKQLKRLNKTVLFLKRNKNHYIYLIGHADTLGADEYNQILSDLRSQAVLRFFLSKGIAPNRIRKIAEGEKEPFDNVYQDNLENVYNRRVQVIMFYEKGG